MKFTDLICLCARKIFFELKNGNFVIKHEKHLKVDTDEIFV